MARGDGPDHDGADDDASIERGDDPREAADPSTGRPARAAVALGILVALVAGGLVGFVLGGGAGGESTSDNPDLQALCIVVGTLDDEALDRLEAGEVDDSTARIGAIQPLAEAATAGDGQPQGLREAADQVHQAATRMQLEELRSHLEELRTYC